MKMSRKNEDERIVIKVVGTIDQESSDFESEINKALDLGQKTICLDMKKTVYISSAGLCVLIASYKRALALHKRLLITDMSDRVREVLEVVGVSDIFPSK